MATEQVKDAVVYGYTLEQITAGVAEACRYVSGKLVEQCEEYVKKVPIVVAAISNGSEPTDICREIKQCGNEVVSVKQKAIPRNLPLRNRIEMSFSDTVPCDICKLIVGLVEKLLKDQKVEEEIATEVEKVCALFPAPVPVLCKAYIDQYLPDIIAYIEKGMEAIDVCKTLGICTGHSIRGARKRLVASKRSDVEAVKFVEWAREQSKDGGIDVLWRALHLQCAKAGFSRALCRHVGAANLKMFWSMLKSGVSASEIIDTLKL
jgi:saposin